MTPKTISSQWRAKDNFGIWRYGYLVDIYIYDSSLEPYAIDLRTAGKALDITDMRDIPIYEGDTFEYKDKKYVVEYDPESAEFVGTQVGNPELGVSGSMLSLMTITGNIHD